MTLEKRRKFTVALLVILMGYAALWGGRLTGGEWVELVSIAGAWFGVANALEHFANRGDHREGNP